MPSPLPIAYRAFTASADIAANARIIREAILGAAKAGARVLLTPECSLVGYPSAARGGLAGVDSCAVAEREDELALLAERHHIVLVLGTISPHAGGWSDDAFVCGEIEPRRYRKQCLTPTDRKHFLPGDESLTLVVDHWKLGVAICYDLRFPDVFMRLAGDGADAFLVIAHMAGPDPDPGTKSAIIPQLCAVRAAETATPLVFCNTAADDRYCASGCWDARGISIAHGAEGLMTATLSPRENMDPWYAGVRNDAIARWKKNRP